MTSQQHLNLKDAILKENLVRLMLKLAPPGIVGMLLISLNNFVDALSAGQFIGEDALAAISLALPLTSLVLGVALCIGVGFASVLSRAIGSGNIRIQSKILSNFIAMSCVVSLFVSILGYIFGEQLIFFMGGKGQIAAYGADYFRIYVLGSLFLILAVGSSQLIKAEGKIKLATVFSSVFVIVNITLNFLFVIGLHWKIQGIALATVLAGFVYAILNLTYFISGKSSIPVNFKKIAILQSLWLEVLSVGSSAFLMNAIEIAQLTAIFKSIAYYGIDTDLAFIGATLALYSLVTTPLYGFVQALQPVIGMNYGAGFHERLKKAYFTFAIGGTVLSILMWGPLQFYPQLFLAWLLPSFNFTVQNLLNFKIAILLLPLLPCIWCSISLFQSIGNGKIAGFLILNRQIFLFFPTIFLNSRIFGVDGVYYALATVDILTAFFVIFFTLKEFKNLNVKPG